MKIEFTLSPGPNLGGTKPPQATLSDSARIIGLTGGKWKVSVLPVKEGKNERPSAWAKFSPHDGKAFWYCHLFYGEFNPLTASNEPLGWVGNNAQHETPEEAMACFPQGSLITVREPDEARPARPMIFAIPTDFYYKKGSLRILLELAD